MVTTKQLYILTKSSRHSGVATWPLVTETKILSSKDGGTTPSIDTNQVYLLGDGTWPLETKTESLCVQNGGNKVVIY